MTLLLSELVAYKPEVVNDTSANGGRRSENIIYSGASQAIFPHIFRTQRVAGVPAMYRKVIYHNKNTSGDVAFNSMPFFHHPPGGDHYVWWHLGTHDDTQADITGSERRYGSAAISVEAASGGSTVVVECKNADEVSKFVAGDPIMLSGKATPESSTGNEELHEIDGVSVSDTQVTITTVAPLSNTYAVGGSVSSGVNAGDMERSVDNWGESFAGDGAYDEAQYPIITDGVGTVFDTFTGTFDGSGNITFVGAAEGNIGTFSLASDISPPNAKRGNANYFTFEVAGLSGTPQANDTIVFRTNPAAINVWEGMTVPVNSEPIGTAGFWSYLDAEIAGS